MGTFTDNLLKLTEFPFSYSFIGLLALIAGGEGVLNEEPSLSNIGPLLIIMGFVATTLSVTDPVGALQKRIVGRTRIVVYTWGKPRIIPEDSEENRFREEIKAEMQWERFGHILGPNIPWSLLVCLCRDFKPMLAKSQQIISRDRRYRHNSVELYMFIMNLHDFWELRTTLFSLKNRTLGTTWVVREIDKITAMVYFIIVVLTFILALVFLPDFDDKFLATFQSGTQTEGASGAATGGSADETVGANATTTNNTTTTEGARLQAIIVLLAFSVFALGAVSYMLYRRSSELRSKAWTAFQFLIELDAIKVENERFNPSLKSIEQYLSNGDWTMAEYWVERTMREYDELIEAKFVRTEVAAKDESMERKGSADQIKNAENKKINYQDLGIY